MDIGSRPTVLIVEDSADFALILVEYLRSDYATLVATSGEAALDMAKREPRPDLILLDVVLPGIDGYEVCRRLKGDVATSDIPVIFATALGDANDEQLGFDLGAIDYVSKPYRPALVKARVRNQLELKSHRDQLEHLVVSRTRDLMLTQEAAIYGLGILAEFRDIETGLHIRRTQTYVELLARRLRHSRRFAGYFDDNTVQLLAKSAPLHDIGKVAVPDAVLHKQAALSAEEFHVIRKHTLYGRQVIDRIELAIHDDAASAFLAFAKEITFTHHENWDGSGYHGLRGEEIPVSGRLMMVADIYDALRTARPYKQEMSHRDACRIMLEGDGRTRPEHFDVEVLQAFSDISDSFEMVASRMKD